MKAAKQRRLTSFLEFTDVKVFITANFAQASNLMTKDDGRLKSTAGSRQRKQWKNTKDSEKLRWQAKEK